MPLPLACSGLGAHAGLALPWGIPFPGLSFEPLAAFLGKAIFSPSHVRKLVPREAKEVVPEGTGMRPPLLMARGEVTWEEQFGC